MYFIYVYKYILSIKNRVDGYHELVIENIF